MGMNQELARMYNTPGAGPSSEDLEKQAQVELFCKIAASNQVDLNSLSNEQVDYLWQETFGEKIAEEEEKKEESKDDEEEKKEAAAREHQLKLAHAAEEARADELGRKMAHAYVNELGQINQAMQNGTYEPPADIDKEAGAVGDAVSRAVGKVRGAASAVGAKGKEYGGKAKDLGGKAWGATKEHSGKAWGKTKETGTAAWEGAKKHKTTIGVGVGAAGVGAGAGYAAGRKKESSAIDALALEAAVKLAAAEGFDPEEAADKVAAVFTLGGPQSAKLASDLNEQVSIRALEYLEAAGYPVTWNEQ